MAAINLQPCKTYFSMLSNYKLYKRRDNCLTFFNEGGSRSAKTFDAISFILDFTKVSEKALRIDFYRSTLADCKNYLLADFKKVIAIRGCDDCHIFAENQTPYAIVNGSVIHFRGLDKMSQKEGGASDIVFVNELLSGVSEEQFEAITLRCELMVIADWNPRFTQHWAFDYEKRPNVFFSHTTYKDNPHIPPAVRTRIESFEPTPENIANGTADEWRWKVYGLGVRAAQEGAIFKVNWIDEFPKGIERVVLGLDFGFTHDPTALVKVGFKAPNKLYLQKLLYTPIADSATLYEALHPHFGNITRCFCDSADKYAKSDESMVDAMRQRGLPLIKAKKYNGSVTDGINIMKDCEIFAVKDKDLENEANNYTWQKVHGIAINCPIDEFNHIWDATRYVVLEELKYFIKPK